MASQAPPTPTIDDPAQLADAHAVDTVEVAERAGVDLSAGLPSGEADRRRRAVGPNTLGDRAAVSPWRVLVDQLRSAVVVLLAAAVVAGLAIGEVVEALAVLVVLVVNTIVGFVTELRAMRSMEALRELATTRADVERDDRRDEVDAADLVPGDVVSLEPGARVPADLRLVEANDLTIEESALTGESEPVTKHTDPLPTETPLADQLNMAHQGTLVRSGRGRGVVVATGRRTQVGRIDELAAATDAGKAPLQEGLEHLGRRLSVGVVGLAAALALLGAARGMPAQEVLEVSIALAVAVVPEGLPAVATLTLTVGMRRMARRHALVRRLPVVETLGSTTVIASDKTGTLTEDRMRLVHLATADGADEDALLRTAVLCNDADIDPDGGPVGDTTEVALLHAAHERGLDWRALREGDERSDEVPFDSETKRMAVVVDGRVHVKGAPEVVLDPDRDAALLAEVETMSDRALRPLAFASGPVGDAHGDDLFDRVEPLGVVGLADPPREEARDAIASCHRAGIRVLMITGDQPRTARAIASQLGIGADDVLTGADIAGLDDDALVERARHVDVYARMSPEDKLRVVEALQAAGEVVAVTGDGVNDAPALRRADVGVAMGGTGTEVAREAADIVLTNDDFTTIEAAVEEGRRILANIRRFAQFLFSWHLAVVTVVTVALAAGLDAPLTGLMILWNNLLIDVVPSFALALEPGRHDTMNRPPRPTDESVLGAGTLRRIVTHGLLIAAVGTAAYLLGVGPLDLATDAARTLCFVTLTTAQLLAVFNARTEDGRHGFHGAAANPWLWAALALTFAVEAAALTIPALRELLGLAALTPAAWGLALGLALVPLAAVQLPLLLLRADGARPAVTR